VFKVASAKKNLVLELFRRKGYERKDGINKAVLEFVFRNVLFNQKVFNIVYEV